MKTHSDRNGAASSTAKSGVFAHAWSRAGGVSTTHWSARRRLLAILRLAYRIVGPGKQRALGELGGGSISALLGAMGVTPVTGSMPFASLIVAMGALAGGAGIASAQTYSAGGGTANETGSIAIGSNTNGAAPVAYSDSIAIGNRANADPNADGTGVGAIAIGTAAMANNNQALAIGVNAFTNVAGGVALGFNSRTTGVLGTAVGNGSQATASRTSAFGQDAIASSDFATAIGQTSRATANFTTALGYDAQATGFAAFAIGPGSRATGVNSIAFGQGNVTASAYGAVAIGNASQASGGSSVALGDTAIVTATATRGVALGSGANVSVANSVALGSNSTVAAAATPVPGATIAGTAYTFAGATPAGVVSVGAVGAERQIQNVAAGRITATSTDAINGSQLFATNAAIGTVGAKTDALGGSVATNLGGGSVYNPATGAVTAPTYNVYGTPQNNVGGAITALQTGAPVQFSNAAGTPTPQTPSNNVTLVGAAPGPVTLHNVAAGAAPTDAVNVSQLTGAIAANDFPIRTGDARPFTTTATGAGSLAVGSNAVAGVGSTVVGSGATDNGNANATILGNGANVAAGLTGSNVALGQGSTVAAAATPVPGATIAGTAYTFAGATPAGAVSVGAVGAERQIQNVAAGQVTATSTDAINGSQLFATNAAIGTVGAKTDALGGSVATNLGGGSVYNPATGAVTAPTYTIGGNAYNNVGSAFGAVDGALTNINNGGGIKYFHANSILADSQANGANSVAIGPVAVAGGAGSVAIGNGATDNNVAGSTVLGSGAAVAANVGGSNVALGQGSTAARGAQTSYAAIGTTGPQTSVGEVAVGSAGALRQITGVAAGSAPTDAVNVSQLQGVGNSLAGSLGGGAGFDPATGAYTPPTYSLNNNTQNFNNVGDALGNLDGRTTNNTNAIAGLQNGTSGIVQQANPTAPITVGAGSGGTVVNFTNTDGASRTLTGVAAGQVTPTSTDAINGSQLYGNAASVASALGGGSTVNSNGTVSAPSYSVNGNAYNNVGGAITALDSSGVKYDMAPGGGRGQSITLAGGDPNQPVVIHNVGAGVARTDGANYGQVQDALTSAKQYTNQRVAGLENQMAGVNSRLNGLASDVYQAKKDARTGAAIGLAAASLRYDDRPGKFSIAAGGGAWQGFGAGAFGAGYTLPDGRFRLNVTGATDGRDVGGAGTAVRFRFKPMRSNPVWGVASVACLARAGDGGGAGA